MTSWVRLWLDMPTDPKWRTIARKCGQPVSAVVAVFTMMMTNAGANSKDRGLLDSWSHDDAATAFDLEEGAVEAIYKAMQGKVLEGARLTGWEKRQPLREDDSTPRSRKYRERQANARQRNATRGHAPDSDAESETDADSEFDSATKEEFILAVDWKVPSIEELPPHVRDCVQQWPPGEYDEEAKQFGITDARRKTEAQWCEVWNDHIVACLRGG